MTDQFWDMVTIVLLSLSILIQPDQDAISIIAMTVIIVCTVTRYLRNRARNQAR